MLSYSIYRHSTNILNTGSIAGVNKKSTPGILILVINYPKQIFHTISKHKYVIIEEQVCD